jgi:hypothetical protein
MLIATNYCKTKTIFQITQPKAASPCKTLPKSAPHFQPFTAQTEHKCDIKAADSVKYTAWGCTGFDMGTDAQWGMPSLNHARKNRFKTITANDERFALAA